MSEYKIIDGVESFKEALDDSFKEYAKLVKSNTLTCRNTLLDLGAIVSGTENHLFLLNTLDTYGITGKVAQNKLEEIGITTNKNMIPGDILSPRETSGLRIGFAAVTTRGCDNLAARIIAELIHKYLKEEISKEDALKEVKKLTSSWKLIEEI